MKYITFDETRPFDLLLLGRVAIDFNPAYNDQVKEEFKPLKDVHVFEKFVGGSPANIAVGVTKHGMKAGFIGKVSDDQFGDYVTEYFDKKGIDTSHITRCTHGEKLGLTFTEMLSEKESHILMYRNCIADLQLGVEDIDEAYIRQAKAILISGTALAESPSREAALKVVMLARRNDTRIIFDIDYREYNWKNADEISIYYSMVAKEADIIMGSREEFDLTEKLIRPGMTDEESAALWQGYHAKIVVIKHLHDPQIMILTTTSGVRIDVESFVNNFNDYDIKCEIVCDGAVLNMPEPNYISVNAKAQKGRAMYTDCFSRFADAYNDEIQAWINASKEGRVDGPTAWDGYACQVAAAAASKARDTQTIVPVVYDEMPELYKK